jgi:hypothetical protein
MWRQCRCVVEIDGPDHLGILKYADDRRRDNTLALSGFTVLRFINSDVIDDPAKAAATIEKLLQLRRLEGRAYHAQRLDLDGAGGTAGLDGRVSAGAESGTQFTRPRVAQTEPRQAEQAQVDRN